MNELYSIALQSWSAISTEGLIVYDRKGMIHLVNLRARTLLDTDRIPSTIHELVTMAQRHFPAVQAALSLPKGTSGPCWGKLFPATHGGKRLLWQRVPLMNGDDTVGACIILRHSSSENRLELAQQSFLSMISHDLRTPLSTILGFAELLYNNIGELSLEEQLEFLEHIIKNANDLSRYTEIVLDIMYLEAGIPVFETEVAHLKRLLQHWFQDAVHHLPMQRVTFQDDALDKEPPVQLSPAALHRILRILLEFALAESSEGSPVVLRVDYDDQYAHAVVHHHAPQLTEDDAAKLFQIMSPRDLSEKSRPPLHRMQLYVASLLAECQQGFLTLKHKQQDVYELDLAMQLAT